MSEKKNTTNDKLATLYNKRDAFNLKQKEIQAQIDKIEKEQHDKEVKELDNICKKNNIALSDVISLINSVVKSELIIADVISLIDSDNSKGGVTSA